MSKAQNMVALGRANEVKYARERLRERVRSGDLSIADAVYLDEIQALRLWDVLGWQFRWGPPQVARALNTAEIGNQFVTVGGLSGVERRALVRLFRKETDV